MQVGHGVRKPGYDAADKSQRLLLGVPAPALKHVFAQHLIRGERVMDPDAGVRGRVKVILPPPLELFFLPLPFLDWLAVPPTVLCRPAAPW